MPGTDFFDDDLQNREAKRRRAVADEPASPLGREVSELNLTRLARHKEDLESQVANSAQELDRLRMRQEELERERRELEDLRSKQEAYERGRRDVTERINQSLIMMENEQLRAQKLVETLQGTRDDFMGLLRGLETVDPESWPDDAVRAELAKALVIIDESRMEYNKGVTRVEALMDKERGKPNSASMLLAGDSDAEPGFQTSFGFWLKAGLAFLLPLILTLLILGGAFLALKQRGML